MRIKTYKLFLETLKEELYKDDDYIFHGLFTPFYDKYYDIQIKRGWWNNVDGFMDMTPGKNRPLVYWIYLKPTPQTKEKYTKEDIQDCYDNVEFDGMKIIKERSNPNDIQFYIFANKTADITEEYFFKELGLDQETLKKAEDFLTNLMNNSEMINKYSNIIYKIPKKKINDGWILKTSHKGIYFVNEVKIWNFYREYIFNPLLTLNDDDFNKIYTKIQTFLMYLIGKILKDDDVRYVGASYDIKS